MAEDLPGVTTWEYATLNVAYDDLPFELNRMASDGWSVVAITPSKWSPPNQWTTVVAVDAFAVIFKRL